MQPLYLFLGLLGLAGYPFVEAKWFRVRHLKVALGREVPRTTILHVSDTHLIARKHALIKFLQSLPGRFEIPDLVIATGDLIDDNSGITPITRALNDLPAKVGRFYVLGSHDYYQSRFKGFVKYFGQHETAIKAPPADTKTLEENLQRDGWKSLSNSSVRVDTAHGSIRVAGVDDPYLKRHDTAHISRSGDEVLAIGLAHAPDVVSEWLLNGFDIVLSGHTHAGQVRIPLAGALVTNSKLPTSLAGGLHKIGSSWLHVSPGLGTSKFAPFRFACRPEITLLEIGP
jgi:uncharacterized protein